MSSVQAIVGPRARSLHYYRASPLLHCCAEWSSHCRKSIPTRAPHLIPCAAAAYLAWTGKPHGWAVSGRLTFV